MEKDGLSILFNLPVDEIREIVDEFMDFARKANMMSPDAIKSFVKKYRGRKRDLAFFLVGLYMGSMYDEVVK